MKRRGGCWGAALVLAAAAGGCGAEGATPMELSGELEDGFEEGPAPGKADGNFVTVRDLVRSKSCSTAPAYGLSVQLAAELACMYPDSFVRVDGIAGVELGQAALPYLQSTTATALQTAVRTLGGTLKINSTWRSLAQQLVIKRLEGSCGIGHAAVPGESLHETGLAIDTPDVDRRGVRAALKAAGFTWYCSALNGGRRDGCRDPVHFETGGEDMRGAAVRAFQRLWNYNNPSKKIAEDGEWGAATEAKLLLAPLGGFAGGDSCNGGYGYY